MNKIDFFDLVRGDVWRLRALKAYLPKQNSEPMRMAIKHLKREIRYQFKSRKEYREFINPDHEFNHFGMTKVEFESTKQALGDSHHAQRMQRMLNLRKYQEIMRG